VTVVDALIQPWSIAFLPNGAADRGGSGTAAFQGRGAGGTFALDLTADTGARITGHVSCSAFAKPEENA
jgi:hypothetical protein